MKTKDINSSGSINKNRGIKMGKDKKELLECPRCKYIWRTKSENQWFVSCARCKTSFKRDEGKI